MNNSDIHRASGTKSFLDLARHPLNLLGIGDDNPTVDISWLRQGVPVVVACFLRQGEPYRLGRLVLQAESFNPITWEHYRFLRGYKPERSLHPPFEVRNVGPVVGPGSWNVDKLLFKALSLSAGSETAELAVPAKDLEFLARAVELLNESSPSR